MGSLVWFRSDLRVTDHPALHAAASEAPGRVTGLFVATPRQWRRHGWGAPKIDFVTRTVAALARDLAQLGVHLRIESCPTFEEVPAIVLRVAQETKSRSVLVNRELEINERRRDRSVADLLAKHSITWGQESDQTIVPAGELRTKSGSPYVMFTPFFRAWVRYLETHGVEPPLAAPARARRVGPEMNDPRNPPENPRLHSLREMWPAGEAEAYRRLEGFLEDAASNYHDTRDDPNSASTSTLSPYLAVGAISARRMLWGGLEANGGRFIGGDPGIAAWLRQLAWRDFYRHVLLAFPRVSKNRAFRLETDSIEWRQDPTSLRAWKRGRTGFPIIDASMRALATTGWMHNRLRMIVASFLSKDLLIDWRRGERHFMNRLVDADLANNSGGWQWASSTGVDAAPYFRVFNPWRQSERFDPEGRFIRRFLPELSHVPSRALHDPARLAAALESTGYPAPIVDHQHARRRALARFSENHRLARQHHSRNTRGRRT